MTTEQLRKVISVFTWDLHKGGLIVSYHRIDHSPKMLHLILTQQETLQELSIVGSVDDVLLEGNNKGLPLSALLDDNWVDYPDFIQLYQMCQWEALSIAIRHEATKELEGDMNLLEMDKTLEALR